MAQLKTFRIWYRFTDQTRTEEPYAMMVSAPSVEIACGQVREKVGEPIRIASVDNLSEVR